MCSIVASWDGTNIAEKSFSAKLVTATPINHGPSLTSAHPGGAALGVLTMCRFRRN